MITNDWLMWSIFAIFIITVLAIDIFLLSGSKAHRVSIKESLAWTIVWFLLAVVFNTLLWWHLKQTSPLIANQKALEFFTGYLIEKSLSIDNIFVFLMIFNYFAIPAEYQRRILLFGLLGAIFMRLILILLGVWLVNQFHWILYLFGAFLLITGIKMLVFAEHNPELDKNPIVKFISKHFHVTQKLHDNRFFIRQNKILYITPLFLVLILIEISDLIFAVDSIPAIFAVTNDPFIIFTSNIFAILGLRALYFLFASMANRFQLLKYGIALILAFVGVKMLIAHWFKIPVLLALGVIAAIIIMSMLLSLVFSIKKQKKLE